MIFNDWSLFINILTRSQGKFGLTYFSQIKTWGPCHHCSLFSWSAQLQSSVATPLLFSSDVHCPNFYFLTSMSDLGVLTVLFIPHTDLFISIECRQKYLFCFYLKLKSLLIAGRSKRPRLVRRSEGWPQPSVSPRGPLRRNIGKQSSRTRK